MKKLMLLFCLAILLVGTVSAFEFDNVKTFDDKIGDYGKITITNAFGLGDILWDGTLDTNTANCGNDCSAITNITLHEEGSLLDEVRFYRLIEEEWKDTSIRSYNVYIQSGFEEVDDYEEQCVGTKVLDINGTEIFECSDVKVGTHNIPKWEEYNLKDELPAGDYIIKLAGEKNPLWTVDWQIKTNGKWTDEWAVWGVSGVETSVFMTASDGSVGGQSNRMGIRFTVANAVTLVNATQWTGVTCTNMYLYNRTGVATGTLLSTKAIVGNTAIFDYDLVANNQYFLVCDGGGYTSHWDDRTFPFTSGNATVNSRVIIGVDEGTANVRNIKEFVTQFAGGSITLNSPVNYYNSSSSEVIFNATATQSGATLVNMSLWHNASGTFTLNDTNLVTGTTNETTFTKSFSDGSVLWGIQSCDSDGACGFSENRTVNIDTTAPAMTINLNQTPLIYTGYNQTLNWNATDINLDSCWYNYNGTNTSVVCSNNYTVFKIEKGYYNITLFANDTANNVNSKIGLINYTIFEESQTYDLLVYETELTTFNINLTYNSSAWSTVSSKLNYNGINYTGTQIGIDNNIKFQYNLSIPPINASTENKTFYWHIILTNVTGTYIYDSRSYTQTISELDLHICNMTETPFVNFSIFNATSPFASLNASFKSTWNIFVEGGLGTIVNNSYQNLSEVNQSYAFCIEPVDKNYTISANIEYYANGYAKNFYYLRNVTYANETTTNISLYLLSEGLATLTELEVIDSTQTPKPNVIMQIQLYDVGTDTFYTIANAKTDFNGEDFVYLNWYNSLYKFILIEDGEVIYMTDPYKIISTPQIFKINDVTTYSFDKFKNFQYNLYYNENTTNFVLTFTKPSGEVDEGCLRVIKRNSSEDTQICLTCESSSSATLYCNIGSYGNGTYIATFYATGSLWVVEYITETIGGSFASDIYDLLGNEDATAYAFLFAGITTSMFLVNPILGILGIILALGGAALLGFTKLAYISYAAMIIIGGGIIWLIKK